MIRDLLACAWQLTANAAAVPTQASLRRAVSTAYYAMFHSLAREAADLLASSGASTVDSEAWTKVYRGLQHGFAKESCKSAAAAGFSRCVVNFAEAFIQLQEERHKADYDPIDRLSWLDTGDLVYRAAWAIDRLSEAGDNERRRFAIHVLFKFRSG